MREKEKRMDIDGGGQIFKLRLWLPESLPGRMLRRMQSKAKVQKSLKDPRGSLH